MSGLAREYRRIAVEHNVKGRRLNIRIGAPTVDQLAWLIRERGYTNRTAIIETAIDRMFTTERSTMTKRNLTALADAIYTEVFGHLDDKYFAESKIAEIRDWLEAGDLDDNPNVTELAAEWREYDADDVAANRL